MLLRNTVIPLFCGKSSHIRGMISLEGGSFVVFYYLSGFEICPFKKGGPCLGWSGLIKWENIVQM